MIITFQPERVPGVVSNRSIITFQPERVPEWLVTGVNMTFQPEHVLGVVSNRSDHYVSA